MYTRLFLLFFFWVFGLALNSCGSSKKETELTNQVAELSSQVATLTNQIAELSNKTPDTAVSAEALPQAALPVLKIGGKASDDVYLQVLSIQVEVTGNIAYTRYIMGFKNRTDRVLEGELTFPLPDGRTVTHYALDINGRMRDAVPVEKAKATQVFEEIEQRRVDPGLLERVEGNNFRTRIYPIPANGVRTIEIGYEEELALEKNLLYYRLPMAYPDSIEKFVLNATVWKGSAKPLVPESENEISFNMINENYVASFSRDNYRSERALVFALPAPVDIPQVIMQPAQGSHYFLASIAPKVETRKKQWSDELAIVWDVSLSGSQRNLQRELEMLNILFSEKKNAAVHLYLLNNKLSSKGKFAVTGGNWGELKNALTAAVFDGGTDFSQIDLNGIAGNEILFFSDGLSTLSDSDFLKSAKTNRPVHCIVSSAKSDYSNMKLIAGKTKGKFINVNALSSDKLKSELLNETLQFLGTEHGNSIREVYPSIATPVYGNFSIAGISDANEAELTLLFGFGDKIEKRIKVQLNAKNAANKGNAHKIWAQKKIAELDLNYEKNKSELTELGQQFGIVTRNTSLIVLETVADYIRYNIEPPVRELELRAEYQRRLKSDSQRDTQRNILDKAVAAAENIKKWWNTDFTPKKPKYPVPDGKAEQGTSTSSASSSRITTEDVVGWLDNPSAIFVLDQDASSFDIDMEQLRAENPELARAVEQSRIASIGGESSRTELGGRRGSASGGFNDGYAEGGSGGIGDILGGLMGGSGKPPASPQPKITIKAIKKDNDYLKLLTGKIADDYKTYLKLREDYANSPTFYFDMADWFYTNKDKETALRILTSIAELELENASLYRLLGYRLKEYGEYALEKFICKKVVQWRPMEPQSYRDLALALADNGETQAALDSLYSLLVKPYSNNISQRSSDGIAEVVVTEINRLIAKNPKLNASKIDKRLIVNIPIDIRVVINWNMDNTDIDLHVKDPSGEECYYEHSQTSMGGRISMDITSGYGPEQFLLKKAVKGKYQVYVNYFGDRQFTSAGPSTIMAEIFTKYASGEEQRQIVSLQMSNAKKKDGRKVEVAEFSF